MGNALKILAIDDDKFSQKFIMRAIGEDYETLSAYNGEEGIIAAEKFNPDIILLDVEMPGLNGYEVCDKLKLADKTKHIPILFLSGRSSIQERMQGFEVGADDYIVKPFVPETLIAKINVLTKYRDQQSELKEQVNDAQKTAYIAMTGSSELGQAMSLVEQSYSIDNFEALTGLLFGYTDSMGLNCSISVNNDLSLEHFSSRGRVSPLEAELLTMLRNEKRFHDFSCRTVINYPNISLLIKNMPLDDMERYGRIKDLMPPILGAFDAKIRTMNIENALRRQSKDLNESFVEIQESVHGLADSLTDNSKGGQMVLSNMLSDLVQQLPGMALEDDQENYILDRIELAIETASTVSGTAEKISEALETVIIQFKTLIDKQNALIETSVFTQEKTDEGESIETSMDIELF